MYMAQELYLLRMLRVYLSSFSIPMQFHFTVRPPQAGKGISFASELVSLPTMLSSLLLKATCLISAVSFASAQCNRTCDILYFANFSNGF